MSRPIDCPSGTLGLVIEAPDTRYAEAEDGGHLAYQVLGEGPVDILLLMSSSCIDLQWEDAGFNHALARLSRMGRLICMDWRGCGSSDSRQDGSFPTFETWIDDIRVVLDAAGSTQAVVIGEGAAGFEAMMLAATRPTRVAALILPGAMARWLWAEDYPIGISERRFDRAVAVLVEGWGTGASAHVGVPARASDPDFRRWFGRYERLMCGPTEAAQLLHWGGRLDVRAVLPAIRVPTLVIAFDTALNRAESAAYLAEHIPDARLVSLPGQAADWLYSAEIGDPVLDQIEQVVTGDRPEGDADRMLATVLFTDIVSSTVRAAEVGDRAWSRLLDEHDAIVGRALERHRGRQVKTTGDGVLAVFDGPARAIRCAQTIGTASRGLGLEVRAGLHTGEIEIRGDDIGGLAVHIASRVAAMAEPGEVVVSRTVTDLVVGSGIEFRDRGEHELKGVPGSWRLFAVAA